MVKAENLVKEKKKRENLKNETFEKILKKIEKKIINASLGDYYFTWYTIPEFIIGLPLYSLKDCSKYIIIKLEKDGFELESYEPNILLIKWFPKK
jgi:hypothetical protein